MKNTSQRKNQLHVFLCLQGTIFSISIIHPGRGGGGLLLLLLHNPETVAVTLATAALNPQLLSVHRHHKETPSQWMESVSGGFGVKPKTHLCDIQRFHFRGGFYRIRIMKQGMSKGARFYPFPLQKDCCFTQLRGKKHILEECFE